MQVPEPVDNYADNNNVDVAIEEEYEVGISSIVLHHFVDNILFETPSSNIQTGLHTQHKTTNKQTNTHTHTLTHAHTHARTHA